MNKKKTSALKREKTPLSFIFEKNSHAFVRNFNHTNLIFKLLAMLI